jgi:iron complex outermembrane receptor protein
LFGRNTPAGVVKFDSVKPSTSRTATPASRYGNYGTTNVEGAQPAADRRLGGAHLGAGQHRDDWVKNTLSTDRHAQDRGLHDRALRARRCTSRNKSFSALFNVHNRDLDGSPRLFRANIIKPGTNDLQSTASIPKMDIDGTNEQRLKPPAAARA